MLLTLVLLPPYLAAGLASRRTQRGMEAMYFRLVLRIIGLAVRAEGRAVSEGAVLFAANHVSYLDILVLGALVDARFIAKAEVKGWPGIGFLARISGTRFIQRKAAEAGRQTDELAACLKAGQSLILFAEGTSSDGSRVLPFKSSLFGVVDRVAGLTVQPVAIRYTALDGAPVTSGAQRDVLAWHGDMTLAPHLWAFLGRRSAVVQVAFLEAATDEEGRKAVAGHCHCAVSRCVA